jgi:ADP-ribose pyrophosphatase YjhB (NUDIX family)
MSMSEYYKNLRAKFGPELIFMPSVAGIIRNENQEILFGRKCNEENWGLIAGAIELGETPSEAIRREALEETGLIIEPERIVGVFGGESQRFTYNNGHQVEYLSIVFECKILRGELNPDNDEMKELRYFKEIEIPMIAINYPKEIFRRNKDDKAIFE